MKRMSYFVIALALMLGLSQCKKESIEPQNEGGVRITLNVENSGNRHAVDTELGTVTYQDGDVIYVGDGSHFIGTLTRESGTFSGTINPAPDNGEEIHFYFLGGLTPSVTPEAGSTSDFTVNISDQTSKLPVLSYEYTTYYEGTTEYSCELKNKCGLVRFPLANAAGSVKVSGMHTEATISFDGTPGITPTDATGQVSLYSVSNTEKWAILLPQGRVTDAYLQGVQVDVPQVTANIRIVNIPTIGNPATMIDLDHLSNSYTTAQDGAIIYGDLSSPLYRLSIADGATVTLRDAKINRDGWYEANFAGITCNGDATIILEGENIVKGFSDNYPGIQINGGKTLTIMGDGSLTVSPKDTDNSRAAGIGAGNYNGNCGNIVITGGSIYATGGKGAAAIGACDDKSCGYITITDGVTRVEATKGGDGTWGGSPLSIGKGADSESGCGTVTIGGTVYWDGSDYQNDGYAYLSQSPLIYYPSPTPTPSTGTTITWDNTNVFNSGHNVDYVGYYNQQAAYEGITITFSGGEFSNSIFAFYFDEEGKGFFNLDGNQGDSFTFTAPQGKKFTKIKIIDNEYPSFYPSFTEYGGWTKPAENRIEWNGTPHREVILGGTMMTNFGNLNSIVFTLVDEE
jgi:plastocyanin